jgi:hypothetical protein
MKFESNATAPISILFNIQKDEYRITVPCENNKIYNFDGTGKILVDWNYPKFENKIENKVYAFSENGDRFYASIDSENNLILQNRKGKRVNSSDTIFQFKSSLKKMELDEKLKPVYFELDSTGYIKSFSSNNQNNYSVSTGLNGVGEFIPVLQRGQNYFAVRVGSVNYLLSEKGKIVSKNEISKNLEDVFSLSNNYLIWFDGKNNLLIHDGKIIKSLDFKISDKIFVLEKSNKELFLFYKLNNMLIGRILN